MTIQSNHPWALLLLLSWSMSFLSRSLPAQHESGWSGRVHFAVESLSEEPAHWDYLPKTIAFESNGTAWRIDEKGTSFERIWLGTYGSSTYSVLFHFLGHAVELLETCPQPLGAEARGDGPLMPCPWPALPAGSAWPDRFELVDGPARYALNPVEFETVPDKDWPKGHFDLPKGYEPQDRIGLAALLTRLESQTRD